MKGFSDFEKLNSLLLCLSVLLMLGSMTGLGFSIGEVLSSAVCFLLIFFAEKKLGKKGVLLLGAFVLLASVLVVAAAAPVRSGAAAYMEQVFKASEAVNRYRYIELGSIGMEASGTALSAFRGVLAAALEAALYMLLLPSAAFIMPAAALGLMSAFCAFFGLSPSPLYICAFGLALLLSLIISGRGHLGAFAKGGIVALYLAVCVVCLTAFGGVDQALEARSEAVRDRLSYSFAVMKAEPQDLPEEENLTHKESRLQEVEAKGEDSSHRPDEFNKNTEYQQEISRPRQVDYAKIVLMLLLSILLIVVPFVVIFFVARAQRKASAYRMEFQSEDSSVAVRAIFRHIAELICMVSGAQGNINYSELEESLKEGSPVFGKDFAADYKRALKDWQLASYSLKAPDPEERAFLLGLSDRAERSLYLASDRKKRFRLRFIDCLVSEEAIKEIG